MNPVKPRRNAPPRPRQRGKGKCNTTGKARFPTFDMCVAAALRVSRHVGPLRCYLCPACSGWHFTRLRVWKG